MKPRALFLRSYERPFKAPVLIKGQELRSRRGFWIEGQDSQGRSICAECAPLPGWHPESLGEVEQILREYCASFMSAWDRVEQWSWQKPYFGLWQTDMPLPRSLQTSLEILLFLSLGQAHLPTQKPDQEMKQAGLLRAQLGSLSESFEDLWSRGFRTFKLKIRERLSAEEADFLESLRKKSSEGLRLRLDANQLPGTDVLRLLKTLPVEFWEEPARQDVEVLQALGIPLACDESLGEIDPDHDHWPSSEFLILKPNHLGFQRFLRWMQLASVKHKKLIMSNTYESEPTLQLYALLYGTLVSKPYALGFGTLSSFVESWPELELFNKAEGGWPQSPFIPKNWPHFVSPRSLLWTS